MTYERSLSLAAARYRELQARVKPLVLVRDAAKQAVVVAEDEASAAFASVLELIRKGPKP